jgi:hypothetical protein
MQRAPTSRKSGSNAPHRPSLTKPRLERAAPVPPQFSEQLRRSEPAMSHYVLSSNIAAAGLLLALAAVIYLSPSIIAVHRDHRHAVAILVFNLFLGWTFLGWVIALVWADREWLEIDPDAHECEQEK